MPDRSLREEELLVRVGWIVKVRWLFLAVLAVTIVTGRYAFEIRFPVGKVLLVWAVILLYNVGFEPVLPVPEERVGPRISPSAGSRHICRSDWIFWP